ncbi:MAG: hypothetical protein IJW24_03015 [Clostridia bacterium]|nr:hypothetical protein [Clostridia bacterium]
MGSGGVTNRGVEIVYERSLRMKGKPNSRSDRYKNGKRVQSRWYDKDGNAERNRDYEHQDSNHTHFFPHDHDWNWDDGIGHRGKDQLNPDYENYF